ncbi:MAG: hypothetical protein ACE15C_12455 [Phycisphaerae bacterium]
MIRFPHPCLPVLAVLLCWPAQWAETQADADPPTTAPATLPAGTSRPVGRWYCYLKCDDPAIVAFDRESIWFCQGAALWRHDVKAQTTRQTSPLDGVNLLPEANRGVLSPDGKFALPNGNHPVLWDGKAWKALPDLPDNATIQGLGFDGRNVLWAFSQKEAFRWEGAWRAGGKSPSHAMDARMGGSWMFYDGSLGPRPHGDFFASDDLRDFRTHPAPATEPMWRFLNVGEELYGAFYKPAGSTFGTGKSIIRRITAKEMTDKVEADAAGVDVTGKGFLKLSIVENRDDGRLCQVVPPDGDKPPPLVLPYGTWNSRPLLLRDANGHIWVHNRRWDGRAWMAIMPPCPFPWRSTSLAFAALDPATAQLLATGVDDSLLGNASFDLRTRTAWVFARKDAGGTMRFVRFDKDGRTVLKSIDVREAPLADPFKDRDGRWWWTSRMAVYRLDADGQLKTYPAGPDSSLAQDISLPSLSLGLRGNVWLWHGSRFWARYGAREDMFIRDAPQEDFSFQLGRLTLAALPAAGDERAGRLWRKGEDGWEPLANPFGQGDVLATSRCVRAGRLLVTCWQGAFEYDAATGDWTCLHDGRDLIAGFDAAGRRILCTPDATGIVYVFDGDPFTALPGQDPAVAKRFAELLKLMDDPDWQVRVKATQEVKDMGDKAATLIKSALRRDDLPAEVRSRLEPLLKGMGAEGGAARTNLFSRMHPPLKATRP